MATSFCQRLPKIELHAHLNGSISYETLKELREYNKKSGKDKIDEETWTQFEKDFLKCEIASLSECFSAFRIAHSVTVTSETVKLATERVIEDFSKDNVIYLELRSTLREEPCMSKTKYLESMIKGVNNCKIKFPNIIVKLIVSINRKNSLKEADENVDIAIRYSQIEPDIVVGIDLSGDPSQKNFTDYNDILNKAREEGLKITIHFAEIPGDTEVCNVLKFQPDRLGHGTYVHESVTGSQENWNSLLKSEIPVEVCLTSNIICKTVTSLTMHHFQYLYNAGHPVIICTDDKSVFQTTLSKEYDKTQATFNLSDEDLWKLSYNAIDHIFSNRKTKKYLKDALISWRSENIHLCQTSRGQPENRKHSFFKSTSNYNMPEKQYGQEGSV